MENYAWRITDVTDNECRDEIGMTGPRNVDVSLIDNNVNPQRFRMYTDDYRFGKEEGEQLHIYEGTLYGEDTEGFEPLYDFGMPNYGCTIIAFWQEDKPQEERHIIEVADDGGYWVIL